MRRSMNILYIVPFWPYIYTSYLFQEVAWMRQRGHHAALISTGDSPGPHADLAPSGLTDVPTLQIRTAYRGDAALHKELVGLGPLGVWGRAGPGLRQRMGERGCRQGLHEWLATRRAVRFARRQGTQVIEAHWATKPAEIACDIHLATRIPFAVRLHGGDLYRSPSPLLPRTVEHASALCPVSQFLLTLLTGKRPVPELPEVPKLDLDLRKIRVCHNGILASMIADQPAQQNEQTIMVGSIGRLDPEKRHSDLIEAIAPLLALHPGLRLRLIGGGVLETPLRDLIRRLGIADRVEITGTQPWATVMELARTLHIYVQTSSVEACSLATVEGQSRGVPMLLSRTGAAEQCVEEGRNGHLFDTGDVPTLTRCLRHLIEVGPERRRRMGAVSLEIVRQRFCFERQMELKESILQACLAGQPLPDDPSMGNT